MSTAKKATKPKAGKHPGGRPTKYSADILKKTWEYIASCTDEEFEYHKTQGISSNTFERKIRVNIPTMQGLSLHLKVNLDTLNEWALLHHEFSGAIGELKAEQARRLMNNGLNGDYSPQMAKFLLSANHGMKERVDATTNDKDLPAAVQVNNLKNLTDDELIKLTQGDTSGTST
ncbi:terminase small subunit [Novosphingobium aquae]|uniref:Terminase small subunit n=1 Tax=Novosphingobium aquae TaxID=3133435 RepID=A0ABU8SBT0_9SPHN